jgi:hypothetical protein
MSSIQRLGRGLPGYLILFAPHAFAHVASVLFQQAAYAIGVLVDINAFYRYTDNSACPSHTLAMQFRARFRS